MKLTRGEWAVLIFTVVYMVGFSAWFLQRGNFEFVIYISTMLIMIWLVGRNLRKAAFPAALLWALTAWGLAHMAGGGVPVGEGVLYGVQIIPIAGDGELTLLKYDQIVHAYGFGVTAWLLWHLMVLHYPKTRGTWTASVYPAIGAMGLGSVNEIIEFSAVLLVQNTGVGGYFNTALDLVMNALGAVIAVVIITAVDRRRVA